MLISQDVWTVSTGIELIRDGSTVTFKLAGSAEGFFNPETGVFDWFGSMEATFGAASDFTEQFFDRPMDLSLTQTLTAGVALTGSYDVLGSPSGSATFSVILFDAATTYGGTSGIDYVFGSAFADTLSGGAGDDGLDGGAGNDILNGGAGRDHIEGGDGRDCASYAGATGAVVARLYNGLLGEGDAAGDRYVSIEDLEGSSFNDHLYGDANGNRLMGRDGSDTLFGLNGNDLLIGGKGADFLYGDGGSDTASYAGATARVIASLASGTGSAGDAQGDAYNSIENLTGTNFDDQLTGDDGANTLNGGGGNDLLKGLGGNDRLLAGSGDDLLIGGAGGDWLDGGLGNDTVSYAGASAGVTANLAAPAGNTGDAQGDTYVSIENLIGTSHNDQLAGNASENLIVGGAGNDSIDGGAGSDRLSGGAGLDDFRFTSALDPLNNVDRILDYNVADDHITLENAIFTALGVGALGATAFTTGAAATTANHHVIYNSASGLLLYDADGVGGASAVTFAQIAAGLALTAAEFFVV